MIGNVFQLAGCLLPFILLFGLNENFESKRSQNILDNAFGHLALGDEIKRKRLKRTRINITKYESNLYGAWSAIYILIGYIIATAGWDCTVHNVWLRLVLLVIGTAILVFIASRRSSSKAKTYASKQFEELGKNI